MDCGGIELSKVFYCQIFHFIFYCFAVNFQEEDYYSNYKLQSKSIGRNAERYSSQKDQKKKARF